MVCVPVAYGRGDRLPAVSSVADKCKDDYTMITYEAILSEISLAQAARDSLPSNVHIGALFDLQIRRLWEQAAAIVGTGEIRVGHSLPVAA